MRGYDFDSYYLLMLGLVLFVIGKWKIKYDKR